MKGYWVVKVNVLHPDKQKLYAEHATEAVKKYNGKFLVRGGEQTTMEGKEFKRNVIVEYETIEIAKQAYNSEEYQSAIKHVENSANRIFTVVEGV